MQVVVAVVPYALPVRMAIYTLLWVDRAACRHVPMFQQPTLLCLQGTTVVEPLRVEAKLQHLHAQV
jgi:hypothetical protein